MLTKAQRNELFKAIAGSGLSTGDFLYDEILTYGGTADEAWVKHGPSGSEFKILRVPDHAGYASTSQVGDDPIHPVDPMNFPEIVTEVWHWGKEIAEWMEVPDLWAQAQSGAPIPGELTPESGNTPFSPDEQAAISAQLKAIAQTVKETYALTTEQSAKLDERFEEAAKASERVNRKDWGLMFGGAVLSLVLADIITPDVMGHIFTLIEHGLGHLFTDGTPVRGILSGGQE